MMRRITLLVLLGMMFFIVISGCSDEDDPIADGDVADGDATDGDQSADGDSSSDGDQSTDGDISPDGDVAPDGDQSADGDFSESEQVDGDQSESEADAEAVQDLHPPTIEFSDLQLYQGVKRNQEVTVTVTDDVAVSKVELFVNSNPDPVAASYSEPFTLTWVTDAYFNGIASIRAVATDGSGKQGETERLPVVIINGGLEATLVEGNAGFLSIPEDYDGTQEVDVKHHWNNPENVWRIMGLLAFWPPTREADWDLELTMGTGYCPHSGMAYPESLIIDSQSPMWVDVSFLDEMPTGQNFIHISPLNAVEHKGEYLTLVLRVFLFHDPLIVDGDIDNDGTDGDWVDSEWVEADAVDGDVEQYVPVGHSENLNGVRHRPNYADPLNNCIVCHSATLDGGVRSCYDCHNADDHTLSIQGKMHKIGTSSTCTACHGPNNSGGLGPACSKCH